MTTSSTVTSWDTLIGNTPLVELQNLLPGSQFKTYAKLEMFNPGGSMKDRSALAMISAALDDRLIAPGGTVIESSSGNMGIGLAQACLHAGLQFICVVDERANSQNIRIIRSFGAEVEVVRATDASSDLLQLRLQRVKELVASHPGSYWPNQYANENNAAAYGAMMAEIESALPGTIDYLFCATGTCGTIRGCSDYIKSHGLQTKVVAVDAKGSVIFGDKPKKRLIPGHGASIRPALFKPDMADRVVHTSEQDCITGCYLLRDQESLLAGGSSGAVVMALQSCAADIPAGANVVLILADRGERYMDTIYNDAWVEAHIGKVQPANVPA